MEPSSTNPKSAPAPESLPGAGSAPKEITVPRDGPRLVPQKYVRTYEMDMEALKKGWTPNLAPLKETPPPPEPKPPPSLKATEGTAPPPPVQIPTPPPALLPVQSPLALEKHPEPAGPSPLQTYANDFSQRIKDTKASTTTILAAQQDARVGAPATPRPSHAAAISVIVGVLLLLVGGAGAYIAYSRYIEKTAPVPVAPTASTPIFVDEREKIVADTPDGVLRAITESLSRMLPAGAVRLLYTDLATTTDNSVFSSLQLPAPGILLRNINALESMAGVIHSGGVQTPFFILSVASYSDTFAGMLTWETTMPRDLSGLYPPFTQTTATTTPLLSVFFHDEVVGNHDVRIYRDAAGRSILLYGYWDQKTLLIARDPEAFSELLRRLSTSRTLY